MQNTAVGIHFIIVCCVQLYMKGLAERWKMMPEEDKEVSLSVCLSARFRL